MSFEWFSIARRHLFILALVITTRRHYNETYSMLVMASGGQNSKHNEQLATPGGEPIKRYTVPVASAGFQIFYFCDIMYMDLA